MKEGLLKSDKKVIITSDKRLDICRNCPLLIKNIMVCNSDKWMNPDTLEVRNSSKNGYIRGCGCLVSRKVTNPKAKCPAGLW